MDKIMTPSEWYELKTNYPAQYHLKGEPVWDANNMQEYADYVASERLKQGIKLPEYEEGAGNVLSLDERYETGWNSAIDEVKRLNGIQE